MTVVIHFTNKRFKSKSFQGVYSIIHKPESYIISYADFSKLSENGPEVKKEVFKQKDVKWMTIH